MHFRLSPAGEYKLLYTGLNVDKALSRCLALYYIQIKSGLPKSYKTDMTGALDLPASYCHSAWPGYLSWGPAAATERFRCLRVVQVFEGSANVAVNSTRGD